MIKLKIKKSIEKMIGGAGDFRPDSEFDSKLLDLAIDKEIGDHGLDPERAKEVAKDEFTIDDKSYSKEVKKRASRKLSEYWRSRAKRRARNAGRSWINKTDYNWALEEQNKSSSMNGPMQRLFEKEFEITEELSAAIEEFLKKAKSNRELKVKTFDGKPRKKPSGPQPPPKRGEGITGRIKKAAKKGPVVAMGAGFGGPGIGE